MVYKLVKNGKVSILSEHYPGMAERLMRGSVKPV